MTPISIGRKRQAEIYLNGFSGRKTAIPVRVELLEHLARKKLSKTAFGYIFTGAGSNRGIYNNSAAFEAYKIQASILRGVENPDLSVLLFGERHSFPILFAPVGALELAHPKGDLELARASKLASVIMIQSNQASYSMEACSEILEDSSRWFQLYFSTSRELVESMVHRAEKTASTAIVLTLDTTLLGWRSIDLDHGYLPFMSGKGIAQYTADPVFRKLMCEVDLRIQKSSIPTLRNLIHLFKSYPGSFLNNILTKNPIRAVRTFFDIYSNPMLNWEDVKWLKSITKLPILLKGILTTEDARKAIDLGMSGIIVSNHGGRQLDKVISSLEALRNIKKQIPSDFPLLLDSGIRSGSDVFVALASGATSVCIGRPYVYALAIAGSVGVVEYVQNVVSELSIMMSLTGCKNVQDINETMLT